MLLCGHCAFRGCCHFHLKPVELCRRLSQHYIICSLSAPSATMLHVTRGKSAKRHFVASQAPTDTATTRWDCSLDRCQSRAPSKGLCSFQYLLKCYQNHSEQLTAINCHLGLGAAEAGPSPFLLILFVVTPFTLIPLRRQWWSHTSVIPASEERFSFRQTTVCFN